MPKINVYLSDELAEAVKEANLPVSAICQRALEQAVRRVTSIREMVIAGGPDDPASRFSRFTDRARTVLAVAIEDARADGRRPVASEHLLSAVIAEGDNLALRVLRSMEIEPDDLRETLTARRATPDAEPAVGSTAGSGGAGLGSPVGSSDGMGSPAGAGVGSPPGDAIGSPPGDGQFAADGRAALELTVTEATSLGHNYVGTEHMLLGLIAEPDGLAGQVLRAAGAEMRLTRRAVTGALAGYMHLKAQGATDNANVVALLTAAVKEQLAPVVARLDRLEQRSQ
jgi:ATP-dependent Clp protease ATP-binding subunit ClpA